MSSSHGPAPAIPSRTALITVTMCIPAPIPSGWQRVCLKQQGRGLGHGESCSLFCSPNGKKFRTLEDVHKYNSELELKNLEKEKMSYSYLPAKHSTGGYQFVPTANQQKLMCNNCPEQFYNTSGLKKHEREKHSGNPSEDNVSCAQCKFEFSSAAEKLSHMSMHSKMAHIANQQLQQEKKTPPGPALPMAVKPSGIDSRLQNFQYNKKEAEEDLFNTVFRSNKLQAENVLKNITGLNVTKNPSSASAAAEFARNELRRRYARSAQAMAQSQKSETVPLPPAASLVAVTKPFSIPGPPLACPAPAPVPMSTPISGADMLKAMAERAQQTKLQSKQRPGRQQRAAASPQQRPPARSYSSLKAELQQIKSDPSLRRVTSGRVAKRRSGGPKENNSYNRFKISVGQVCRFLGVQDYPIVVTDHNRQMFRNYANFESYYLPLVATINPRSDPLKLKTLCGAKWREVVLK